MISQIRLFNFLLTILCVLGVVLSLILVKNLIVSDKIVVPEYSVDATIVKDNGIASLSKINDVVVEQPIKNSLGNLSKRFRLAGTVFGAENFGATSPMAIIDDREMVVQKIVMRAQEVVPGVRVVSIKQDSVVLADENGEEEIFLERVAFSSNAVESNTAINVGNKDRKHVAKRFGGREVFPNRWEFDREAVLDYYEELYDNGERMLSVFDSMDPVYEVDDTGRRWITGYVVGVEGEQDLFTAAGLENGDIVRTVNSVPMTNRRYAENFIRSFVEGKNEMFVLEVERNGELTKQVYTIK